MPRLKKSASATLLLACAGLQACGHAGLEGRQTIPGGLQAEMREIRRAIELEVGDARAEKPGQCRVLPLGSKACGGPQAYLVYSTAVSDERRLEELGRQYTEAEQKYNRVTRPVSTCTVLAPPEVRLEHGRCTTVP